jgi:ribosomal protein L37AE/L43A
VKRASAVDLVDKPVVCPTCGDPAMLRRDDQGFWLDCQGKHRPVANILAETLLEVVEAGKEVEP